LPRHFIFAETSVLIESVDFRREKMQRM